MWWRTNITSSANTPICFGQPSKTSAILERSPQLPWPVHPAPLAILSGCSGPTPKPRSDQIDTNTSTWNPTVDSRNCSRAHTKIYSYHPSRLHRFQTTMSLARPPAGPAQSPLRSYCTKTLTHLASCRAAGEVFVALFLAYPDHFPLEPDRACERPPPEGDGGVRNLLQFLSLAAVSSVGTQRKLG